MIHRYLRASAVSLFLCAFACGGATNSSRATRNARDPSSVDEVDEVDERIDGAEGEANDLDAIAVGLPAANVAAALGSSLRRLARSTR